MAEHGAHQQQPDQPWSGPPAYGGPPAGNPPPAPASGPPQVPGPYPPQQGPQYGQPYAPGPVSGPAYNQPVSGPTYGTQPVSGPTYGTQPVSGPTYGTQPVSGPTYGGQPTTGGLVPVSGAGEQPITQIGEIAVTTTMVHTPVGGCPLRGSTWVSQDQWISSQKTPTWAIVLAIVGFCILTIFSLLFLLAKETVLNGVVQVTVSNGPFTYVARIPVYNQAQAQHVHNQVNYARAMAMR